VRIEIAHVVLVCVAGGQLDGSALGAAAENDRRVRGLDRTRNIVPAEFVEDPMDLQITLRLNGDVMQDESSADMIFDVARLISYASDRVKLLPGDLLLTGSPAGNGTHWRRFLKEGDVIDASITRLGTQRNRCVAERLPSPAGAAAQVERGP
jgi:fumarylacetoacetase-like protein